jgi:hypothetical protein
VLVREDVLDEKITISHARAAYGVMFVEGDAAARVDMAATAALRGERRIGREAGQA